MLEENGKESERRTDGRNKWETWKMMGGKSLWKEESWMEDGDRSWMKVKRDGEGEKMASS